MSGTSKLAFLILALVIGYAFIYSPMDELTALMDKKVEYGGYLETVSSIENTKNELLTQFNNISEADKEDIKIILPDSFDFVRLVSQIDTVAAKHGISINNISSQNINPSGGGSVADAESAKPYQSATVGFAFTASYEKFRDFMDDLEKSLRILDIKSIKVAVQNKGLLSFGVEFQTYWVK